MAERARTWPPLPVAVFIIGLVIPLILAVGTLRMSAYRIVLLVMVLPCLYAWMRGKAGRVRVADISLLLMWFWSTLSFTVVHGLNVSIEAGGILFIESVGAYLLGRRYIRNADEFRSTVLMIFWVIVILLPFAVFEAYTGQNLLLLMFSFIGQTVPDVFVEPRWGLRRVQGPFEHPILFGVFCGSMLGLVHYVLGFGRPFFERCVRTTVVGGTGLLALSSGPLSAMVAQMLLISWDVGLAQIKARWKILATGFAAVVIMIESIASRSSPEILMQYFAFNYATAYNRVRIWEYGTLSVANHPLIGIGLNEWERPHWMSDSMDMFWLLPAVRHGIPAGIFMLLTFFSIFFMLVRKAGLDSRTSSYRTGTLITLMGFFISGWMVHYWNATYVLFMFILGASVWMADVKPEGTPAAGRTTRLHSRSRSRPLSGSAMRDRRRRRGRIGEAAVS